MNRVVALSTLLVLPAAVMAVYAPIPAFEQGQPVTVTLEGSVYHDNNILGAASGEIKSWVVRASPKIAYNESLGRRSFFSADYTLDVLHFDERPTKDTLYNHKLGAKVFYTFDEVSELVVSNNFSVIDNPESLSPTLSQQTNQSYKRNVFDARVNGNFNETLGAAFKVRHEVMQYRDINLEQLLNREEWLLGVEGIYKHSDTTKIVTEVRYQDASFKHATFADWTSWFLLVGVDYDVSEVSSLSSRVGIERRDRTLASTDDSSFYGELVGVHRYTTGSFLSGGARYSTTVTDDTARYVDQDQLMIFMNIQHMISGPLSASGSISYTRADLNVLPGLAIAAVEDRILRLGAALTYLVTDNFSVSATVDHDRISSNEFAREQKRTRIGITGRYAFGFKP